MDGEHGAHSRAPSVRVCAKVFVVKTIAVEKVQASCGLAVLERQWGCSILLLVFISWGLVRSVSCLCLPTSKHKSCLWLKFLKNYL